MKPHPDIIAAAQVVLSAIAEMRRIDNPAFTYLGQEHILAMNKFEKAFTSYIKHIEHIEHEKIAQEG